LERLSWRLEGQPEEMDLLQRARAAQNDLTRLFEEVRSYAGPLRLEVSFCTLCEVWREAWQKVSAVHPQCAAQLEEQGEADLWINADCFRLGQVFRNILENAFAACAGPLRVIILWEEIVLAERPALRVTIRDNGLGLGPGPHDRLFEPFYTTKPHGSGLGLAIARRIVEAHGGYITAGNGPEGGAELIFTLPRTSP
jgi:signal transduction histidine kinase